MPGTQRITISIPWELYEALKAETENMTAWIIAAIREELERPTAKK